MNVVKEYSCPSCGAALAFEPGSHAIHCANCNKSIPIAMLETAEAGKEQENGFDWGDYKKGLSGEHLENTRIYACRSCGAQIEADETTAAATCPYCGSNVVLSDRVGGSLKPNAVIPFKISPKELPAAIDKFYKKRMLLPKGFFDAGKLSRVQGVYVPFWLYSCRLAGPVNLTGTTVRTYSDSDYNYTETSHYLLSREGEMAFANVPVDASIKMKNDLMDSLEPFDFSEMVAYNDAYLAGYVADRFDRDPDTELKRANKRMLSSTLEAFRNEESFYGSIGIRGNAMKIVDADVKYVLLPVYLLHCEYNGEKYQYAVNGQTGKVVGKLPISLSRKRQLFWKYFAIFAAVGFAIGMLIQ